MHVHEWLNQYGKFNRWTCPEEHEKLTETPLRIIIIHHPKDLQYFSLKTVAW